MPQYHIWTIGCQMNKADSDHIASYLEQLGYSAAPSADEADVLVVNTCVVRESAERKAINKLDNLRSLKQRQPGSTLILTGCLVDPDLNGLKDRFPHVDLFLPPQEWATLEEWSEACLSRGKVPPPLNPKPVSAFIPIIQGCDNFCTYCIVPLRRGRERSRNPKEILSEVSELAERGCKEVSLLGQNVDSYGHDLPDRPDLADLLLAINTIDGLSRIRFLTSHPKDMSQKLIESMAHLDKVCEHISLPVQAGSDEILQAMGRGYSVKSYRKLADQIRSAVPGVALSTDVIVGFPGETEVEFLQTYDLLRDLRFDTVHVAAYSPRSGTAAAEQLKDDVPAEEKKRRREAIEELQEGIATQINAQLLGSTVEVLVDDRSKGKWQGRTRTDKLVFFSDNDDLRGQLISVRIDRTSPWSLQGERVDDQAQHRS
jgi:tRNA-2-methylthio-N6-dimethylallyladenosine synthase